MQYVVADVFRRLVFFLQYTLAYPFNVFRIDLKFRVSFKIWVKLTILILFILHVFHLRIKCNIGVIILLLVNSGNIREQILENLVTIWLLKLQKVIKRYKMYAKKSCKSLIK